MTASWGDLWRFVQVQAGLLDDDTRPLWLIYGGPQAWALQVLLSTAPDRPYRAVPMSPDCWVPIGSVPYVAHWLTIEAVVLILPRSAPAPSRVVPPGLVSGRLAGIRTVTCSEVTFAGLHPFQVLPPPTSPEDPPLVPYHDLRTVAVAAGLADHSRDSAHPSAQLVQQAASWSLAYQRMREEGCEVTVLDRIRHWGGRAMHAVDRPNNDLLADLACRIQRALGVPAEVHPPTEELLGDVRAPLEPLVVDALGLGDPPRDGWLVRGHGYSTEEVEAAQLPWYTAHPKVVRDILAREHVRMDLLGIGRPD